MKCRVIKKKDGGVIYNWPSKKYEEDIEQCRRPNLEKYGIESSQVEFIFMEEKDLPISDSKTGNYHEMIYFDGECKKENLKQDKEWKACLMPIFLIKQKHLAKLNTIIDEAISDPDETRIALKTLRDREMCESWNDKKWYEQALINLDDRVDGGEEDKPVIRQKITAKLVELSR